MYKLFFCFLCIQITQLKIDHNPLPKASETRGMEEGKKVGFETL